jgi:hypothetical protein
MTDFPASIQQLAHHQVAFVIVGGLVASMQGAAYVTEDLNICYARDRENLNRLATCLAPLHPRLRNAPADLPFIWDAYTLKNGLNFTLWTDFGELDILGEVSGVGTYKQAEEDALVVSVFGVECLVLSLKQLIAAKKAAGRPKDLLILPALEALLEARTG